MTMSNYSTGSNHSTGKVISSDSQTAYEKWQAPHVKNLQEHKAEQAGQVSARQLEELQQQAYDEGMQQGKNEGYAEGLLLGQEEGLKKGQEIVLQIVKRFEQMMQLLAEPLEQVDQQVEEELLALSIATARQIIRREITLNPDQIVAVVKEAISVLPSNSKKIKVHLNPDDAEIIRETLNISSSVLNDSGDANNQVSSHDDSWSIVEEATINRGGCLIKTENSQIDATIETRIAEIAVRIFGDERILDENVVDDTRSSDELVNDSAQLDEVKESINSSNIDQ